jgi:hypothetical protein
MPETITHFVGPRMDVCGRIIQRCTVCGAKICDTGSAEQVARSAMNASETIMWEPENYAWRAGRRQYYLGVLRSPVWASMPSLPDKQQ